MGKNCHSNNHHIDDMSFGLYMPSVSCMMDLSGRELDDKEDDDVFNIQLNNGCLIFIQFISDFSQNLYL